jgi:hypothetical protein
MRICKQNCKPPLDIRGQATVEYLLLSILFFLLGVFVYKVFSAALVKFFGKFLLFRTGLAGIL